MVDLGPVLACFSGGSLTTIRPSARGASTPSGGSTWTTAGAAAWIGAFNARWQVALIQHDLADYDTVNLVRQRQDDFLSLSW
jgi:hypothetical protein